MQKEEVYVLKYNFYENDIKQYSKINIITVINNCYLIEDIKTKKRIWAMKYDIYSLADHEKYQNEINEKL